MEDPITNAFSPAPALIESRANGEVDERPIFPVKLFVLEKVLKSERRVDDADVPDDVSTHTSPLDVVLSVPTVEVESVIPPVIRFVVDAVSNDP